MLRTLLAQEPYSDDKMAGILILSEICLPVVHPCPSQMSPPVSSSFSLLTKCKQAGDLDGESWEPFCDGIEDLYQDNKIADWNIADWLCIKVMRMKHRSCTLSLHELFAVQVIGPGAVQNGEMAAKRVTSTDSSGMISCFFEI